MPASAQVRYPIWESHLFMIYALIWFAFALINTSGGTGSALFDEQGAGHPVEAIDDKEELAARIYRYFNKVNQEPVVYPWTHNLDEVSGVVAEIS